MNTPYTSGFDNGKRYEREAILKFVSTHLDQGFIVTTEDIVAEINSKYINEMNEKLEEMDSWISNT